MADETVPAELADLQLISYPVLRRLLGEVPERTLFKWIKECSFPKPVRVGKSRYWLASAVRGWVDRNFGEVRALKPAVA